MYITAEKLKEIEVRNGKPKELSFDWEISSDEMDLIYKSAFEKKGRAHDFTVFIFNKWGELAMIGKPHYLKGAFRPPSGGVNPGEDIEEGILREVYEETGLLVELKNYILRIKVRFYTEDTSLIWTTNVLTAQGDGELNPIDTFEVSGAKWGRLEELNGPIKELFLQMGSKLLKYRVFIHEEVARILKNT